MQCYVHSFRVRLSEKLVTSSPSQTWLWKMIKNKWKWWSLATIRPYWSILPIKICHRNWGHPISANAPSASRPHPGHLFPSSAAPSCVPRAGLDGPRIPKSIPKSPAPLTFGGLCLGFLVLLVSLISLASRATAQAMTRPVWDASLHQSCHLQTLQGGGAWVQGIHEGCPIFWQFLWGTCVVWMMIVYDKPVASTFWKGQTHLAHFVSWSFLASTSTVWSEIGKACSSSAFWLEVSRTTCPLHLLSGTNSWLPVFWISGYLWLLKSTSKIIQGAPPQRRTATAAGAVTTWTLPDFGLGQVDEAEGDL